MGNTVKFGEFRKLFFKPSINKRDLVERVKHSIDEYDDLVKFVEQYRLTLKSAISLLNNSLYGKNPLPKKFEELNQNIKQYHGSADLKKELNWLVLSLSNYKTEINQFILYQKEYEDLLIKGDYSKARSILEKIENEICVSFWSIENRFILDEYQFGTEANWDSRKKFLRDGIDPFVQSFSNIYSVRAEKTISFYQFNNEIEKWLHVQGITDQLEFYDLNEYLRFKGNFFSFTNYTRYPFFIHQESNASIIDKYIMFKRVCAHQILKSEHKDLIIDLVDNLFESVNDPALRNLLVFDDSNESLKSYPNDNEFLFVVDLYTKGQYSDVIDRIKKYFMDSIGGELQILELYTKSLCELNLPYIKLTSSISIADDVGNAMYEVLMKSKATEDSLIKLVNYSYLFSNSRQGSFIYNFVSKQLGWKHELNYEFLQSSGATVINPLMILASIDNCKNYNHRIENLKSSIAVKLMLENFDINKLTNEERAVIPETKLKLYKARHFVRSGRTADAKTIYQLLLDSENLSIIAEFESNSELFKCYLLGEEYRDAMKLFVNVYLGNQHITKQMEFSRVLEGVIKGKFKNVGDKSTLIELPIFFKINSSDRIRIKQSMELFLRSVDCKVPSELITRVNEYTKKNILYFFKNVCTSEILQLSKAFPSTYQVNEERINICKFLTEFDKKNSKRYRNEITELTLKNIINKVISGIDERKIYVNESKLKDNIKRIHKQSVFQNETQSPLNIDSFSRYVKLHKYIKENNEYRNISPVSFDEQGEVQVSDESFLDEYDVVFYYPAFQIFSRFFLYIRDLFVFNKENGLDTYLSTKIRHGTLPNHLRSVFESSYLVTTQSNDYYVENTYWKTKLKLEEKEEKKVQSLLSDFSVNVDEFSKRIKDDFIQCRTEKTKSNTEGVFDFSYSEKDQIGLYIEKFHDVYDIDEFIELVFQELWNKTEIILGKIRERFNGEFRDIYMDHLGNLENGLLENFDRSKVNELISQIMTCRTDMQYKLNNISQWFRRSESSHEGEYEINVLAQTSIEITRNLNPASIFEIETKIDSDATVRGEYHEHFIDMLNNCLFNIIEHSKVEPENREAKMTIFEHDNVLTLKFSNNVLDQADHATKLGDIKNKWNQKDSNIAKEKGTGYPKVKKIIASDLNRKYSYFDFKYENNNIEIELSFELTDL